jgi:hypothetical protein
VDNDDAGDQFGSEASKKKMKAKQWLVGLYEFLFWALTVFIRILKATNVYYRSHTQTTVSKIRSSQRQVSSACTSSISTTGSITRQHGQCELDSHADTIVEGSNCVILQYTGKECDVSPYRDDYESITNVPIVHAATAWQSPNTGQTYVLVLHELLFMGSNATHIA